MGKGGQKAQANVVVGDSSNKKAAATTSTTRPDNDDAATRPARQIPWSEVKKHTSPEDAWVVYQNRVYDVSNWFQHPGGAVIFTHAGDDMTDIFAAFHKRGSQAAMAQFYIGDLVTTSRSDKTERQVAFEKGYRDLRAKMILMGYYQSNKLYYAYKMLSNTALAATAAALVAYSDNVLLHILSALILGLFFQQCGWLAHDLCHHQVFENRNWNNRWGLIWGDLAQGYSIGWWKNKHNGHHAVPNLHSSSAVAQDGDPDIDTMPLLAWSLKQARSFRELSKDGKTDSAVTKFLIRYQAFTYFPILLLARLSWLNESLKMGFNLGSATANGAMELKHRGLPYKWSERFFLTLHHTWVFAVSCGFGRFSIPYSVAYFLLATTSSGLFLATVFGLGHNGMATYDAEARPDFWKLQVTTTRNVIGGHGLPQSFVDWFCGGLQYQVDHHLFPTMPRHSLPKAHKLVESFCKEWGVQYHEADMVDGTVEVLQHLSKVSDDFLVDMIKEFPAM